MMSTLSRLDSALRMRNITKTSGWGSHLSPLEWHHPVGFTPRTWFQSPATFTSSNCRPSLAQVTSLLVMTWTWGPALSSTSLERISSSSRQRQVETLGVPPHLAVQAGGQSFKYLSYSGHEFTWPAYNSKLVQPSGWPGTSSISVSPSSFPDPLSSLPAPVRWWLGGGGTPVRTLYYGDDSLCLKIIIHYYMHSQLYEGRQFILVPNNF